MKLRAKPTNIVSKTMIEVINSKFTISNQIKSKKSYSINKRRRGRQNLVVEKLGGKE